LGNDIFLCGGSAVLIDPGLSISPHGDQLTITYNATITGELVGEEKVYMHSGAEMAPENGWEYVTGNWGDDDGVGLMTEVDDDIWQITIVPVDYYGYNPEMNMHGIFMIFRNADASVQAGNETGEDIWVNMSVYPPQSYFSGLSLDYQLAPITQILWSDGSTQPTLSAYEDGEYYITAWDNLGCIGTDTINLILKPLPFVDLGGDQLICGDESIILDAGDFESYLWNDESIEQTIEVNSSGTYSVTVTDEFGCEGFDVVVVAMQQEPVANFDFNIIDEFTVEFIDLSMYADTYMWDFTGNGVTDSNTAGDVSYTYSAPGQYAVKLTVGNECGDDILVRQITIANILSILSNKVTIYPNPAQNYFNLVTGNEISGKLKINISDITGKIIRSEIINIMDSEIEINISELASGIYNLSIFTDKGIITKKLIIKK
jgi:hypothetical protein